MSPANKASSHWPFSENAGPDDTAAAFRAALERRQERAATQNAARQHLRNDRLLVGGRAHVKKHGLS